MSSRTLVDELKRFDALVCGSNSPFVSLASIDSHVVILNPKGVKQDHISLTLSSLVHGNEINGLYVINQVLEQLLCGDIRLEKPIALIVANRQAALVNKRFLDRDLNRSFGRQGADSHEDRICRLIEPILERSQLVIDLHQTIEETESPFFIFKAHQKGFEFTAHLNSAMPIVTFWNESASADGRTLTEFAIQHGAGAITFETGKLGLDPSQVAVGYAICECGIKISSGQLYDKTDLKESKIFKIDKFYRPRSKGAALYPGLRNFSSVRKGQQLGNDGDQEILASLDGKILFPKYGLNAVTSSELFCEIVPISTLDAVPMI